MNKKIITSGLLALTVFLTGCDNQVNPQSLSSQEEDQTILDETTEVDKIEIIDFHGTRRCPFCETIEKYTKETLDEYFQKEMEDGKITFQSINGELSENLDIVVKYQARGSSLFINAIREGKDNIEEDVRVWRLVSDEKKFKEYFKEKIENLLN